MKHILPIAPILVLLVLLTAGCIDADFSRECGIENCHGMDIQCGSNVPDGCTEEYLMGDGCRQYARCEIIDGTCQLAESEEFETCKSCVEDCMNSPGDPSDCESSCINPGPLITQEEAIELAQNSECTDDAVLLTDKITYNSFTRTWWIDLDLDKPGCLPACVVNEETRTSEINWRCTGLIIHEKEQDEDEPEDEESEDEEEDETLFTPLDDTSSTTEGVDTIVEGNNQLAIDLYSQFKGENEDKNLFFSPYSISVALTMTYEGAKGETAEEMQTVLHIPEDSAIRRPNFAKVYNDINQNNEGYKLSTANALWALKDYQLLEEYTSTVEDYYGGKVTNLDFGGKPEESRQTINTWIEEQTNNKIKDLIPKGILDAYTRLVLTNAIYFKGTWLTQFDEEDTIDEEFTTSAGGKVEVPMMRLIESGLEFNYMEDDSVQVLELPYEGEDLSMLLILPKESDLESVEESLTPEKIEEWNKGLRNREVRVYIPKFKFETKYFMAKDLKEMGMPLAFSPSQADLSGIAGTDDLYISSVIHQAFVEVNEEGIEAAAATAVIVSTTSIGPGPSIPVFKADHPFIFIIQQEETGNILFMGRVSDPS